MDRQVFRLMVGLGDRQTDRQVEGQLYGGRRRVTHGLRPDPHARSSDPMPESKWPLFLLFCGFFSQLNPTLPTQKPDHTHTHTHTHTLHPLSPIGTQTF